MDFAHNVHTFFSFGQTRTDLLAARKTISANDFGKQGEFSALELGCITRLQEQAGNGRHGHILRSQTVRAEV